MAEPKDVSKGSKTYITQCVALVLVVGSYSLVRPTPTPLSEQEELATHFKFTRFDLPTEQLATGELRRTHSLHPSLDRVCAWVSCTGASVALADLDGDGLPNDMCLADPRLERLIVMPAPGTGDRYAPFSPDPAPLVVDPEMALATGAVVGDFNEDGLADMLVYFWGRTPIVYLRKAASTKLGPDEFYASELVASDSGKLPTRWYTHAATQADVDGDGHVDLVMGNFFPDNANVLDPHGKGAAPSLHAGKSKALNGGGPKLFLWHAATSGDQPTVEFADVSESIASVAPHGWSFAVGAADLDGDMLPEVYYANDFGPDRLFHNRSTPGKPQFALAEGQRTVTTPKSCVLGKDSFKGMGVSFADLNHDGFLDIYVSNIADQMALHESHFVWMSTGKPEMFQEGVAPYIQGSEPLGMSRSGWGWDTKFADMDNNGEAEGMQATGMIKGTRNCWPELQQLATSNDRIVSDPALWPKFAEGDDISGHNRNPFFVRRSNGRMAEISVELGPVMAETYNSRGIAIADVDGDGRLDFALANQWEPSYFFKNDSPNAGSFLGLYLLAPVAAGSEAEFKTRAGQPAADTPGRPAIGACATVTIADGKTSYAQVDGGSGHAGRSSPTLHFGLGSTPSDRAHDVQLVWRDASGRVQHHSVSLQPGWHTVVLGSPAKELSQK